MSYYICPTFRFVAIENGEGVVILVNVIACMTFRKSKAVAAAHSNSVGRVFIKRKSTIGRGRRVCVKEWRNRNTSSCCIFYKCNFETIAAYYLFTIQ